MRRSIRAVSAVTVTLMALALAAPAGAKTPPRPKRLDAGAKSACANATYALDDVRRAKSAGGFSDADLAAAYVATSIANVTDQLAASTQAPERYYDAIANAATNNGKVAALTKLRQWCGAAAARSRRAQRRHSKSTLAALSAAKQTACESAAEQAAASGDYNQVRTACLETLRVDAKNVVALYNLGIIAQTIERNDTEAASYYEKTISADPADYGALYNLAIIETARGDKTRAIDLYQRAIAADQTRAEAPLNLGFLLAETGDTARAKEYFRRAVSLNSSLLVRIPYGLRP